MSWEVRYHPEVQGDLDSLGGAIARRVLQVIDERIARGEPNKTGKPLRQELAGCRRIRTGDVRIVYRVYEDRIRVVVVAVGPRRDARVHRMAAARVPRR